MGRTRATLNEWVLERYITKGLNVREFFDKVEGLNYSEIARRLHLPNSQSIGFWIKRNSMPWGVYLAMLGQFGEPKHHRPPQRIEGERAARLPVSFSKYVEDGEVRRKKKGKSGSERIPLAELREREAAAQFDATPEPTPEPAAEAPPAPPPPPTPIPSTEVTLVPSLGVLTVRVELVTPNGTGPKDKITEVVGPMTDKEQALLKRIRELEEQVSNMRLANTGGKPPEPTPMARIHNVARTHPELSRALAGAVHR